MNAKICFLVGFKSCQLVNSLYMREWKVIKFWQTRFSSPFRAFVKTKKRWILKRSSRSFTHVLARTVTRSRAPGIHASTQDLTMVFRGWNKYIYLPMKKLNYGDSCRSIESSGWFIKKQDRWRHYQLHSNVGAFALPARNPTDKVVPNLTSK